MKLKLFTLLIIANITFTYANNTDANNTNRINKTFQRKYLQNVKIYKQQIQSKHLLNKLQTSTASFKLKTYLDKNETKRYSKGFSVAKSKAATAYANETNAYLRSQKFSQNINGMKQYILNDKGFNYQAYLGKYKKLAEEVIKGKTSQNNFLSDKEKIYIVISSSMPKQTIKNYIVSIQPVRTDIEFVLRGIVGNNLKYFMPTFKWVRSVLKKPNCDETKKENCYYKANIEINPKVTEHFNIKEVPAVIFVKNYNGFLDAYAPLPKKSNEEAYIAYGDANIIYALEKINQKAKDRHLTKLIKAMNGGFFEK